MTSNGPQLETMVGYPHTKGCIRRKLALGEIFAPNA